MVWYWLTPNIVIYKFTFTIVFSSIILIPIFLITNDQQSKLQLMSLTFIKMHFNINDINEIGFKYSSYKTNES